MNNSFDYLISRLLLNYSEKDDETSSEILYNSEYISREFRKILDKIVVEIVYDTFENEDMIQAVLSLNRIERIIAVFSLILGMSNAEIAFLLNSNMNSMYGLGDRARCLLRILFTCRPNALHSIPDCVLFAKNSPPDCFFTLVCDKQKDTATNSVAVSLLNI